MIASALSVELMVTILQHSLGLVFIIVFKFHYYYYILIFSREQAPSYINSDADMDMDSNQSCLGMVPHQVNCFFF